VHNRYVVENLEARRDLRRRLDEVRTTVPSCSPPRVPKAVPARPGAATFSSSTHLPAVSKVHREAERHHESAHHRVIGHAHPE